MGTFGVGRYHWQGMRGDAGSSGTDTQATFQVTFPGLQCLLHYYLVLYWRSNYFVNIFVRGGGGQSEVMKPYTAL